MVEMAHQQRRGKEIMEALAIQVAIT
jgi:hypothetical protein